MKGKQNEVVIPGPRSIHIYMIESNARLPHVYLRHLLCFLKVFTAFLLLLVICRSRTIPRKVAPQDSVTLSTKQFHEVASLYRKSHHFDATRMWTPKKSPVAIWDAFVGTCNAWGAFIGAQFGHQVRFVIIVFWENSKRHGAPLTRD